MKVPLRTLYISMLSVILLGFLSANAQQTVDVTMDFEDTSIESGNNPLEVQLPPLTVLISHPDSVSLGISNLASFGQRSLIQPPPQLDPSNPNPPSPDPFVMTFSPPVQGLTFSFGGNMQSGETLTAKALSPDGSQELASTSISCCEDGTSTQRTGTLVVPATNLAAIALVVTSNLAFSFNPKYFDNFVVTVKNPVVDSDGDGLADDFDFCKHSVFLETVVIDGCNSEAPNFWFDTTGCTTTDYVMSCSANSKDHAEFLTCVRRFTNDMKAQGVLSGKDTGSIQTCAAQSNLP